MQVTHEWDQTKIDVGECRTVTTNFPLCNFNMGLQFWYHLSQDFSLYWWILNILSIHTTKHNLNFDTFYLMKYPFWLPPNPNTVGKLRPSAFQRYKGLGVADRVFLFWLAQNGWGCDFTEFDGQIIFSLFLWLRNPVTIPTNFFTWAEMARTVIFFDKLWLVLFFLVTRCDFLYLGMNCDCIWYTTT